jgi:cellulose synthase/poly-beta-1,6-N-acetylglucosamine synthase-like glycosyltransferase
MTPGVAQALLNALLTIEWVILLYFFLLSSFYGLLLMSAVLDIRPHLQKERGENRRRLLKSEIAPRITLLAPAYNEAKTIAESLRALLGIQYPNLEVIVINDGSKDETLGVLHDQFGLSAVHPIYRQQLHTKPVRALYRSTIHPNLVVVDKENGGKADSLNAGLNIAANELVCAIDADTLIEPDALQRMVRAAPSDGRGASGGVPPRLSVRSTGVEPPRRQHDHIRRIRIVSPRGGDPRWRLSA